MTVRGRRRLDVLLFVIVAGLAAGAAAIAAAAGDTERVARIWASARIGPEGGADIVEVIDYDFGVQRRHGIFRDVPGLPRDAAVRVESPSAPAQFVLLPAASDPVNDTQIRIGDPSRTISGRHRYRIAYSLFTVTPGSRVDWDAVGTEWGVVISNVEVHLLAPYRFTTPACFRGGSGSTDTCVIEQPEPGHLVVHVGPLQSHQGVSIEAGAGELLDAAPASPAPPGPPTDPGAGEARPAAVAALFALLGALPVSMLVRRRGREQVATGGATDAAHGETGDAYRLVDVTELADMATTEFAPPEGIAPAMGGVVLTESVRHEHKVAWLIGAAIDGYIELEEPEGRKKVVRLHRLDRHDGEAAGVLDLGFAGRDEITLGAYDSRFASMWGEVGTRLVLWQRDCDLWDHAGTRRRTVVRVLGVLAMLLGATAMLGGAALSSRWGSQWLAMVGVGAAVLGGGWAATVRAWELKVRTPAGSAAWLKVESFRRFLHDSEAFHAEEAAKRGVLREYTAWAVAVGEIDRWSRAVGASAIIPQDAGLSYVAMAPMLGHATSSASTAPSSSSSGGGGGGGGSVGGGGGGGGGGSW
jgi:uncharacterized membrane protein YgcG